jgi:hypothetical protein
MSIAGSDTGQEDISPRALVLAEYPDHARTYAVPKKRAPATRFGRAMHVYLRKLIKNDANESVKSVAARCGISQGHLNDQFTGMKPTTMDAIDAVARLRKKTATDALLDLLKTATELDRSEPGWDDVPTVEEVSSEEAFAKGVEGLLRPSGKTRRAKRKPKSPPQSPTPPTKDPKAPSSR